MKDPLTLTLLLLSWSIVMTAWLEQCDISTISQFPDEDSKCCDQEGEWLILRDGEYACEPIPCFEPDQNYTRTQLLYKEECRDVMDGVCGEEALGERLYLGEDGRGHCDCAEGWVRYEGRCYQEFTPAFCPGNDILRLTPTETFKNEKWVTPDQFDHFKLNISCMENPCHADSLPHSSTWKKEDKLVCHKMVEDLEDCEVVAGADNTLKCCKPYNRGNCYSGGLTLFSVALNCVGNCSCERHEIWSQYLMKCVNMYLDD